MKLFTPIFKPENKKTISFVILAVCAVISAVFLTVDISRGGISFSVSSAFLVSTAVLVFVAAAFLFGCTKAALSFSFISISAVVLFLVKEIAALWIAAIIFFIIGIISEMRSPEHKVTPSLTVNGASIVICFYQLFLTILFPLIRMDLEAVEFVYAFLSFAAVILPFMGLMKFAVTYSSLLFTASVIGSAVSVYTYSPDLGHTDYTLPAVIIGVMIGIFFGMIAETRHGTWRIIEWAEEKFDESCDHIKVKLVFGIATLFVVITLMLLER